MKRVAILMLAATAIAGAQVSEPQKASVSSISFSVKETASKKSTRSNFESDSGSYDRDISRRKSIEVELHNLSHFPTQKLTVSVLWVIYQHDPAKYIATDRLDAIGEMRPASIEKVDFTSLESKENVTKYALLNQQVVSTGSRAEGYIVAVLSGDSLVGSYGSNPMLAGFVRDPKWMLDTLKNHKSAIEPSLFQGANRKTDEAKVIQ